MTGTELSINFRLPQDFLASCLVISSMLSLLGLALAHVSLTRLRELEENQEDLDEEINELSRLVSLNTDNIADLEDELEDRLDDIGMTLDCCSLLELSSRVFPLQATSMLGLSATATPSAR